MALACPKVLGQSAKPCLKLPFIRQRRAAFFHTAPSGSEDQSKNLPESADKKEKSENLRRTQKSMAEVDEEMRKAMENLAGDGGEAGVELEDGKPVAMKRGVRENMFRYI
ncbi:uncharacterized protein Z518_05288 [Rhinocladiella mackenziei CBS 650.93]|uniref:Rhinocladiella mackenziei CBS 650.93 unplaced genomic scaffold supercont1.4, whole genome shotgun sequence n=1 Tax=Rhinocladiella mackenziei CBS 650.93 TaxID=1442369 RepID=A0A0D2J5U4_9EURO|nr:uncharacterized protein Z518_05288 [Rhinocladiella mackenziei CBS 650.93]KIX04420.1 hypothetical protein Z518_05288 [Rhinocladiella mackenziei CBS 650.93]